MTAPRPRPGQPKPLDAGVFQAEISSFRLHLAAEGKAGKTIRSYTEAVQWFAAAHLLGPAGHCGWGQVDGRDIQEWMTRRLGRYRPQAVTRSHDLSRPYAHVNAVMRAGLVCAPVSPCEVPIRVAPKR